MSNKRKQDTAIDTNPMELSNTNAANVATLLEGLIIDGSRGLYYVETAAGRIACTIRGRLRKELEYSESRNAHQRVRHVKVKPHDPVAIGDRVRLLPTGTTTGVIEQVVARAGGAFTRRDPDPKAGNLTTVAGLDQMVIVFAVRAPEPHLGLLDRFLVVAEAQQITPIICMSKIDLNIAPELAERLRVYQSIGYAVIFTSIDTGVGIAELRTRLAGRTSALLGKSGVGKSSLLNALEPGLAQRVSEVNIATGKGRHTTTSTRLFPLSGTNGGYIADTAGIRALGLNRETEQQLDWCFPEFRPHLGDCQMRACQHLHEPDCAIRSAVQTGAIDALRYDSYCRMRGAENTLALDNEDDGINDDWE